MPNIIIAFDHLDEKIGSNCQQCYSHLGCELNFTDHNIQVLAGDECSSQRVHESITAFNEAPFIFIAYSHGKEDALYSAIEPDGYVTPNNSYFFGNSLIYTNSCFSGLQLKNSLLESLCLGFVGYEDKVLLPYNSDDEILFIACENKCIIHFLTTNDTLFQSYQVMKAFYQEEYDKLYSRDIVLASRLLRNLECLVIAGDFNLTREKFITNTF